MNAKKVKALRKAIGISGEKTTYRKVKNCTYGAPFIVCAGVRARYLAAKNAAKKFKKQA